MSFYDDASWLLIPSGIEEDIVFAQKPTSGLGDLNFQRASDATYTDASGVVRRSPYNLLQQSEMFSNAAWTKFGSTIGIDATVAPNGTLTADSLIGNGASDLHQIQQIITVVNSASYTLSIYAKKNTNNFIQLTGFDSGFGATAFANFDLNLGVVGSVGSGATASIQSAGNGWYRCIITMTSINTSTGVQVCLITSATAARKETNTLSTSVFIWGAQLVEGTQPLDYFPTTNRQDVPRIDFRNADGTLSSCGRLLLEPQRTNSIRNSSMVGAVAGTPGTLPTNWAQGGAGSSVTTRTIVGTGTENGLPYIDIRYQGNTAGQLRFITESGAIAAASVGSVYTNSTYIKLVSGTAPQIQLVISNRDASNNFISDNNGPLFNLSSTLTRYAYTATIAQAGTAFVQPLLQWTFAATAYDFTIRIAAPQMELGAYATTWVPTTTAAVTRLADTASKTGVSSLIGQTEGTVFMEYSTANLESYTRRVFSLSDGTNSNQINLQIQASTTTLTFAVLNGAAAQAVINTSTNFYTLGSTIKIAVAYKANDFVFYANGTQIGVDISGTVPTCSQFRFADPLNSNNFIGGVSQYALFPTRLTNAELAQLTTL